MQLAIHFFSSSRSPLRKYNEGGLCADKIIPSWSPPPPDPLFGETRPSWWMLLDSMAKFPVGVYYQEVTIQSPASVITTMEMAKNPMPSLSLYRSLLVTVAYGGRCGLEEADCERWLDSTLTLTPVGFVSHSVALLCITHDEIQVLASTGHIFYHFPLRENSSTNPSQVSHYKTHSASRTP